MLVSDFDFELPESAIAQEAAPRGTSRLLRLDATAGLQSKAYPWHGRLVVFVQIA